MSSSSKRKCATIWLIKARNFTRPWALLLEGGWFYVVCIQYYRGPTFNRKTYSGKNFYCWSNNDVPLYMVINIEQ